MPGSGPHEAGDGVLPSDGAPDGRSTVAVLYVTDDRPAGERAAAALEREREDLSVAAVVDPGDAVDRLAEGTPDCVVSRYATDGTDGIDLLAAVREAHPDLPFVLVADGGSEAVAAEAVRAGATDYLPEDPETAGYGRLADRIVAAAAGGGDAHPAAEHGAALALLDDLYDVTTDPELALEDKIGLLLELGCERLGLPYGFLSRIVTDGGEEAGTQRIVRAHGDHELLQPEASCPLEEAYCRRTIETDGLLAVADAPAGGWEGDPAYERFDLGSYVGGKVLVGGELYGTLCFASSSPRGRPFSEADRTVVRVVSKWLGYELERQQSTERLQRQNDRLQEFTGILAHDLRNPLSVATGRLDLARDDCDSEHLGHVRESLDRMEELIEDVLALAREGEVVTDDEPVDLAAAAADCWRTVDTAEATLVTETDRAIRADRSRLRQLLENLVRNAVEHAGPAVTVTVGDLPDGFYVEDDGPGIPPDEREEVFASGYSTADDGTGFGLAIAREIAEAHGWTITAVESPGGGARFEITGVEFAGAG